MAQNDTLDPLVLASLSSIGAPDDEIVASAATAAGPAPNDSADTAVAGAAARATFAVSGAGVTIGIISDSFNSNGQAAANQAAGYLPNVTVLGDQTGTDEGQAIAELVHETAPGAAIVFDAVGTTLSAFASAVTALQNAGSKIIIDDVGVLNEPFFELGDVLETAIEKFIAAGGSYFTSAGNDGGTYYQAAFNGISAALPGTTALVTAENFGGGSILESFTHTATFNLAIDLQWETPFRSVGNGGPNGTGAQDSLALYVYNSSNALIASRTANVVGGDPVQYLTISNLAAGSYKVAVVLNGGAAPGVFRYEFVENNVDDTISDPKANTGGGNLIGHAELADVNTVGAVAVNQTPSQGVSTPVVEPYSSTGPGQFLLDGNGRVLATPVTTGKVDFTAPDGSSTSVTGFAPFYGTSAAAPVAAASAALLLQLQPGLTPAQISADLAASAVDQGGGANVGAGLIQATGALAVADGAAGVGLVVDVSEDAYLGNAQFTVSVDGTALAGVFTAKASHAAGQTEAFTVAPTLSAGSHQVAVSFTNDLYGGTTSTDRNLYVDAASYDGVAITGGAATLDNNGTHSFTAWTGSGLVVDVAEDAYQGDAQFTATIDGKQVGGVYTVTASNAAGQFQAITLQSVLGTGEHTVGISFINDAYGGSSTTDRNLYITGATYNGTSVGNVAAALLKNDTDGFGVQVGPTPTPRGLTSTAVLSVSEDAYAGNAQFDVFVDGTQYGGVYTVTASHAAGQSQNVTISGIPEQFASHDIAVTFLNDLYDGNPSADRNLYVNAIQFDGTAMPGCSATLLSDGTQHFTALAPNNYMG